MEQTDKVEQCISQSHIIVALKVLLDRYTLVCIFISVTLWIIEIGKKKFSYYILIAKKHY